MPDLGKQDEAGTDTVALCILGEKKEGKKNCSIFSGNLDLIWSHVGARVAKIAKSARKSHSSDICPPPIICAKSFVTV